MMLLATRPALTYPCHRRVENANTAAPRSVIAVFFRPKSALDSAESQSPTIGRLAGDHDRKAWCCSVLQFSTPASLPAPKKPGFNHPQVS